jgi:hypothetical protein
VSLKALARLAVLGAALLALVSAGVPVHRAAAPVARRSVYPHRLPPGAGREIAEARCVMCHSALLVAQQHKDSTGWEKTVHQMELWSAPVPAPDRDTLFAYLLRHFGPPPPRTP